MFRHYELHTHSFFSDGELLPSELIRRAYSKGCAAIAITDHADVSNLERLVRELVRLAREQSDSLPIPFIPGIEITHVPPSAIPHLALKAKELGAGIVVVHGETIMEPVYPGTNRAAVECPYVDILAHPGFITVEEAAAAAENGVYLEISARKWHCLTNGHVVKVARLTGAKLLVNSDAHSSNDLMDPELARKVAMGAGLEGEELELVLVHNPVSLIEKALQALKL
ncbi:MAG: histidinol phosphate phosphatase domain-containing protein [Anaerolineae bacterium]|nr:histidinol phosphate phosphatase domain-containing protein [Anaerolineae bacterium]MDW8101617.1 histidinol phosphate phosphatase domain-containing protein [Anaerolineae bacterium]